MPASVLAGSTVLITGGARRLGRAMALALADSRAALIIHYNHSRTEAEALVREIEDRGGTACMVQAELTEPSQATALWRAIPREAGPVHYLINNASIFSPSTLEAIAPAELERTLSVNTFSPMILAREFARCREARAVVNMLDTRVHGYDPAHFAYQLSKNLLGDLTRMMALEFAPRVRVNGVAPGSILPPPDREQAYLDSLRSLNLLKEPGRVSHITDAVLFLLSNSFITGEILTVDGGQSLKGRIHGRGWNASRI